MEQTLGRSAVPQAGNVFTFRFPRTDLALAVGDVKLRTAFALGGWSAFMPVSGGALAMGDLVVTPAELPGLVRALETGGAEVMAIHNHLLGEAPHVMYVHFMMRGDPAAIANTVRTALSATATPLTAPPVPPAEAFPLDTAMIARALGAAGKVNGGVYQTNVARAEPIICEGVSLPPAMGVSTVINVQPVDATRAAAAGDFVLTEPQVSAVIRALTAHGFAVTAVHSHLIASSPSLRFVHFWAVDSPVRLADGLAAALAIQRQP